MTTEDKICEAFERKYGKGSWADKFPSPAQSGFMYGYVMGMAEAFEAAANVAEEVYDRLAYDTALDAAVAIREMAKENGK